MHSLEHIKRINNDWDRYWHDATVREALIENHERRLGVTVDRADPMLGAVLGMEWWLIGFMNAYPVSRDAPKVN